MGLDDFKSDDSSNGSSISTRKQIENVQMEETWWELAITTEPAWCYSAAGFTDKSSAKAIVQKMNEALDEGFKDHAISEELAEDIEYQKQKILEDHIWD